MTLLQSRPELRATEPGLSFVVTPSVAAHRGASGYRPEHTLAAFELAIGMGADEIELDLVSTADGVLVVRHESDLRKTTDIVARPEFAGRRYVEQLTLAELRILRACERKKKLRPANTVYDGKFAVPTFEEVLELAGSADRSVGVLAEIKHPAASAAAGLPIDVPLLETLARHGLDHARSRVNVMAFEPQFLRDLATRTDVGLIQLVKEDDEYDLTTREGLMEVQRYAAGVGLHHKLIGDGSVVRAAHDRWLTVHAWTLRAENTYLPKRFRCAADPQTNPLGHGDLDAYAEHLMALGVDGLITDHPDLVLDAVQGALP